MDFEWRQEIPMLPAQFWDLFFSDEFTTRLYAALPIQKHRLVEKTISEDGSVITRKQWVEPAAAVPPWAAAWVPSMAYHEIHRLDRGRSELLMLVEPAHARERFDFRAVCKVTQIGTTASQRVVKGHVQVRAPLIGGKIERMILDQFAQGEKILLQLVQQSISASVVSV